MKRSSIVAAIAVLLFSGACTSGARGTTAAQTTPQSATTGSSTTASPAQTAIPDGVYRTRPRTEQDLIALGLSKTEIEAAKENEQWHDTIVYELRISGDHFLLTATSDDENPTVEDQGTFIVDGQTLHMTYVNGDPEYTMRFSMSGGELRLKLLEALCKKTDPEGCWEGLVRAAYEALPFEAVT
jgi:hypothetical protein